MDANQRDQKQGACRTTCLFHPNACHRITENQFDLRKGRRTYARAHPKADACRLRSACFWKLNAMFMLFCVIYLWVSIGVLPAIRSALSSSQRKLVGGYFMHKQQQGFSPPVSNEGELMFQFQKLFPTVFPQRELNVMPTMCCLWYLLPLKWVKERQLVFPQGFSPQNFSIAGPAAETTATGSQERVQLHCLHDKSCLYLYRQRLLNWKFCSCD